ncbi:MAG: MBL fold metallo-hydrolase [Woeseiaceae bacterium]
MGSTNLAISSVMLSALFGCGQSTTTTEFCLDGELDLGARYQGLKPEEGERYPTTWCVVTDDSSSRVLFHANGRANPDLEDTWTVAYLPPDTVRIVNRESPPDIEFQGTDNLAEALRVRRLDPRRLVEEYRSAGNDLDEMTLTLSDDRLTTVTTAAELPLRGSVPVVWRWRYETPEEPEVVLQVDGTVLFEATGRWRIVPDDEAAELWQLSGDVEPVAVPGDRWPASVNMQSTELADGVYMVSGVRTGFRHLVVDTPDGLVVADAPAGWVEFYQLPPADLVPGLGTHGLSENFIEFLEAEFPGRPLHAVALTHFHDDHAGGAPAFASGGATVYAPEAVAGFLSQAFSADEVTVQPVADRLMIGRAPNRVALIDMGPNPHVSSMLGVWAVDGGYFFVSDVHVPRSEDGVPRIGREQTEIWFADWALRNLPEETKIVNSHSAIETPIVRLRRYLDNPR